MKLTGAMLLFAACGGLGLSKLFSLRKDAEKIGELIFMLERMELEICVHRRSLPETLKLLEPEKLRYLSGIGTLADMLPDKPFAEMWRDYFRAMALPVETEKAICDLGWALCSGTDTEKSFSACLGKLKEEEASIKDTIRQNGKVYVASGFALGSLLVIASI